MFEYGILVLCLMLMISVYNAGYWKGKFQSLYDETADHFETYDQSTKFLQVIVNKEAQQISNEELNATVT